MPDETNVSIPWRLHWLEAEGTLESWRDAITAEIEAGRRAIASLVPLTPLDILVQRVAGAVIPETGTVGRAYRKGMFSISVDPLNPNFEESLRNSGIRRTVVHEAHHCMRMGGPGLGYTLGEALVSEGLAGRFVGRVLGTSPEPWERALDDRTLDAYRPNAEELAARGYDHASWFFGSDGRRPRWLGYTLGYRIVGDWLDRTPPVDGRNWIDVPAATVLAAAGLSSTPA